MLSIVTMAGAIDAAGCGALAFTSANGVRAAAGLARFAGPVFAVGAATAAAARGVGFSDVIAADGDIASLAAVVAATAARLRLSGPVLHIAGAHIAGDLGVSLAAAGVPVRRVVAYEAVAAAALPAAAADLLAITDGARDVWVSFFSPRTAKIFIRCVSEAGLEARLGQIGAAALSPNIAAHLDTEKWREVIVAPRADGAELLNAIRQAIAARR